MVAQWSSVFACRHAGVHNVDFTYCQACKTPRNQRLQFRAKPVLELEGKSINRLVSLLHLTARRSLARVGCGAALSSSCALPPVRSPGVHSILALAVLCSPPVCAGVQTRPTYYPAYSSQPARALVSEHNLDGRLTCHTGGGSPIHRMCARRRVCSCMCNK